MLTLYSAADLLTRPGCPVCRYAAEASDRYLGWFALEAHAQPATITRLCASLGTCARHTRRLMSQPGAAVRLTVVYRYVVTAARDRLTGRTDRLAICPACDHDGAAAARALDTLLEGLADPPTRHRCHELGGLCLPHVAASAAKARRQTVGWLTDTVRAEVMALGPTQRNWLAGTDADAETRAVLRSTMPATGVRTPGSCASCQAAAQAERDALQRLAALASGGPDPDLILCAHHLADAGTETDRDGLRMLLGWQARCLTARLSTKPSRWLPARWQRHDPASACPACRARQDAARRALAHVTVTDQYATGSALCVRHHLVLAAADPRASHALSAAAIEAADRLIDELADAFDSAIRARSRGAVAGDSGAWRRAAAFLDGAVFGGYPARPR